MRRLFAVFVLPLVLGVVMSAQNLPSPAYKEKGSYEVFGVGTSHDNSLGWTTEFDTGVGYDFNRAFSAQAGVPLYLVSATTTSTSGTGSTTTTSSHYNSIGDAYVAVNLHPKLESFGFATALTGTVPTGNRDNGVSTGRPTVTWANHLEKSFDRLTPFVEGTLGNSLNTTQRFRRPFTT